jgi:hypothetical protein
MGRDMKLLTLVAGILAPLLAWAVPAGDIILAQGAAFIRDSAGIERAARVGLPVDSGETLLTRDGRMQMKFSDGALLSLQPETQFMITDYRFRAGSTGDESAVFNLIKGGFRTITGLLARQKAAVYQVITPTATIGIRGTEYQALLCMSSCKEPDGLYVHTGEGRIFLKNAAGEIDVGRGQTAYVASPDTAPRRTTTAPAMTARVTTSAPPPTPGVGTSTDFQPGNILGANNLGPITPINGGGLAVAAAGSMSGTASSNFPGLSGTSGDVSGAGSGAASSGVIGGGVLAGVYMSGNGVLGGIVSGDGGIGSVMFGSVQNAGSNGDLYWGRWSGTSVNLYAGLGGYFAQASITIPASSSLHYLLGTSVPTIPTSGTASFNFVGGTPSTDQAGIVGSGITSGHLNANFGSNYVSGSFNVSHGSNYSVNAFMPLGGGNRANFGTNMGGSGTAGSYAAQVNGFFVGSGAPAGAGLSYQIMRPGNSIVGVGAFR